MEMAVSSVRTGSALTVAVTGELDLLTGPAVDRAIAAALATDGVDLVRVDVARVGFLDSSGLALLLKGRRLADARGVAYRVVGSHGLTEQVLRMTGVWEHLTGDESPAADPAARL